MNELNKRMSAIESLLSRLEEKITPADEVREGGALTSALQKLLFLSRCSACHLAVHPFGSERGREVEEEAERAGREPKRQGTVVR